MNFEFKLSIDKHKKVLCVKPDGPPASILRSTSEGVHPSCTNEYIKKRGRKIEDAHFLRSLASTLSYNGEDAGNKHRLFEIAMRLSTGYYEQI